MQLLSGEQRRGIVIIKKYVNSKLAESKQPYFTDYGKCKMLDIGSNATMAKAFKSYIDTGTIDKKYVGHKAVKIDHSKLCEEIKEVLHDSITQRHF